MGIFQFGFQIFGIISTFGFNFEKIKMEQTFLRTFWISKFSLQNLKRRMGNGYFSLLEKQCEALVQHRDNFSEFFKGASSQITNAIGNQKCS